MTLLTNRTATATRMGEDLVLVGGNVATVERFDLASSTSTLASPLLADVRQNSATLLDDGSLLVIGYGSPTAQLFVEDGSMCTPAVCTKPLCERISNGCGGYLYSGSTHHPLVEGRALGRCGEDCTEFVCGAIPYCCEDVWDAACVDAARGSNLCY